MNTHNFKRDALGIMVTNNTGIGNNNLPIVLQNDAGSTTVPGTFTVGSPVLDGFGTLFALPINYFVEMLSLKGLSDYTSLYDRYLIKYVKFTIRYTKSDTSNSNWPRLEWVVDRDDVGVDSLVAWEQKNRSTFQFSESRRVCTIVFKPTCLTQALQADTVATFNRISPMGWLNLQGTGPNVRGYGLKMMIRDWFLPSTVSTTPLDTLDIQPTYYFALRDIR